MPKGATKAALAANGEKKAPKTVKAVTEPLARKRRVQENGTVSDSDAEDFTNVSIDMGSSDEEEPESENESDDNEEVAEFPDLHISDDEDDENDDDYESEEELDEEELEDSASESSFDEEASNETNTLQSSSSSTRLPEIEANYESDSSTEETENTIGNVPLAWYKDLPHIGYDIDGKKILKPATSDELEKFLSTMEDPDSWKTVRSDREGKDVVLSEQELDIIRRLQQGEIADAEYNPYEPTVEWFSSKTMVTPVTGRPEPKRRFIPSKWEHKKIMKIVRAIRNGHIVPNKPKDEKPRFYNLWGEEDQPREDHVMHVAAPKMKLPEHDESYNPPEEYLPNEQEASEWHEMDEEDRSKNYLPKKYASLRHVPAYDRFTQERFHRCLDLYLAPRVRKNRLNIDPESLVPKLPSPKDLRPFPTHESLSYEGHTARIRALSVHASGLYILTGSDDKTCRLWEVLTGRCLFTWQFDDIIRSVAWNPNPDYWLFAISIGDGQVTLVVPPTLASVEQITETESFIHSGASRSVAQDEEGKKQPTLVWTKPSEDEQARYGFKMHLQHVQAVQEVVWHRKGDYFATVSTNAKNLAVLIHQTSKHQSQAPFRRLKGLVQKVAFHPIKPIFYVATQKYVRVFDLIRQGIIKTLQPSVKWISSIDVHPGGDNVIIGSYDKHLCWFDMDLGARPYKSLRYHEKAVRQVAYHKRYPLFASSSDDGTIQIFYGMVYNDLLQNPLIVPVKILRGHKIKDSLGVLNIEFHPTQPWIFSTGADGSLRLWT